MPRWPDKEKANLELVPPPREAEAEESTAEDTGLPMNDTNILVRSLSQRVDDLSIAFARMIDALNGHVPLFEVLPSAELVKLQRRRTEDEMRHALSLLLSGKVRPSDDDSPQVLEDTINEVFALRKITMDLMQAMTTSYQNGLAAIRKMTER